MLGDICKVGRDGGTGDVVMTYLYGEQMGGKGCHSVGRYGIPMTAGQLLG